MERRDKVNYYLDLADVVSKRGTCLRRLYGAVIVKDDEVIATGYVGAPRGRTNSSDVGGCIRRKVSAMSYAEAFMQRRTPSSAPSVGE